MTVVELKEKLIAKINDTDNKDVLDQISEVFSFGEHDEKVYKLNSGELSAVREGIDQIENGEFFTNDEVKKLTDKCLGR